MILLKIYILLELPIKNRLLTMAQTQEVHFRHRQEPYLGDSPRTALASAVYY